MSLDDDRIEEALARILEKRGGGGSVSVDAIVAENPDLEAPLRARLRVFRMLDGLREPPGGTSEDSSVFASLSRAGRAVSPLSLPDPAGDEPAPVVLPQTPSGRWGRYAVQGEIARGGVGVVLKARDPDLGRDVALKILREEYASSPDVLQRFVEEAQVGGQLQHPGIVPVYELGLGSDGQPYFVMKLVKGKTLASLLAERASPAADRPRFLSVFHAVCQTVAYAHERRIVHRDLKPSNVMVGAFGEVQVLDWGMAKILARGGTADDAHGAAEEPHSLVRTLRSSSGSAPSIEGSVLGTPQYMAPEQARGEVDRLDERADVFSLGAILCEILTGKPPYTGTEREVLVAAAQARLAPAQERLRACGADPQLVDLAARCLAADRADRPRDAGVLAREVTAHLASLEDRARRAEVEAGESRVLATQERRARRLTLSLSAAVVAFVLLGGGGWYAVDHQRRERADAVGRQVAEALNDATRLRGKAEAAGTEEALPLWRETLAMARHAQAFAETSDADATTKERVAASVSEIADAHRRAGVAAEQRRRDDVMAERLDEIRALPGVTWDWKAASADYAATFSEYLGGDVDALGIDEAARRIGASRIRERLVLALESWTLARDMAGEKPRLLPDLLTRIDSDPWRTKLRKASGDVEALRAAEGQANLDALDVQDRLRLAERLWNAGDRGRATALALQAWRRYPGDFWACFDCASMHHESSPPRYPEAMRFYTAALALRPRSVVVRNNMAKLYLDEGDFDRAAAESREAIRIDPTFARAHENLGAALYAKGDLDGTIAAQREAIRLDPKYVLAHSNLGGALQDKGDLDGAILEFREAIRLDPSFPDPHVGLGSALEDQGDPDGAILEYREAIRLDPKNVVAHGNLGGALQANGDLAGAITEQRAAIRLRPHVAMPHCNLGAALYESGDFDGAIAECREAIRLDPKLALAHNNLGIAFQGKGDFESALAEFREAIRLDSMHAETHRNLAMALKLRGQLRASLEAYRKAHELGSKRKRWPYPTAQEVEEVERLVDAAERLPAFVEGKAEPATAQDALAMATAGYAVASYAASSSAWTRAFVMDPALAENLSAFHRYNAACAAALAASGKGKDASALDAAGRARWRRQAVEWLRADLDAWKRAGDAKSVRRNLEHWKVDSDLAGLHDEGELAQASAEDRELCRALWRDVDAALAGPSRPR